MHHRISFRWNVVVSLGVLMALLGWPAPGGAQTVSGQARVVQATVASLLGTSTTTLADTGTLGSATDAREASRSAGSIAALLSGETLHATTIGWPDQAASEASLADLALTIAGTTIGADMVVAEAVALLGAAPAGTATFDGLAINGMPVDATQPNQTIYIPGGRIVVNEQLASAGGIVVNALHIVVYGVADVVIASAAAGVR
jgi:hypothetical protein